MAHHTQKNTLEIFIPDFFPSTTTVHRITATGNTLGASETYSRCHLPDAGIPPDISSCISHKLSAHQSQQTA